MLNSFQKKQSLFLVPGGGNMHLVDSVKKSKDVKYTSFFMSNLHAFLPGSTFSRINGNLGICLVTSGPGSTNVLTSVVGAWIESIPLIIISGQVKTKRLTKKFKVRQTGPQEVDIVSMVKKITKYSKTIKKSKNILYELEKLINARLVKGKGLYGWIYHLIYKLKK